ncbi:MAG: hypothetical protein IH838_07985 [Proteobacteria bacterium]|nr:hypothetical protein [Pseudomonadota bacterium]
MTGTTISNVAVRFSLLLALTVLSILLINPASLIALSVGLVIYTALHVFVMGGVELLTKGQLVFLFYGLLSIFLYCAQGWANPEYFGFSGGLSVGTDDSFFFSLAVDDLPSNFPVRSDYAFRTQPYGDFLSVFAAITMLTSEVVHPLDLILVNIVGLAMIPALVERLAYVGTADARVARIAMFLALVCPFMLANGLILVRDAWMTMFFLSGLLSAISRRYIVLGLSLICSAYFRLENGILLGFSTWILLVILSGATDLHARHGWVLTWSGLLKIVVPPVLFVVGIISVLTSSAGTKLLEFSLYRSGFIELMMQATGRTNEFSTSYFIDQLTWPLRIVLGSLFYFGSPFLAIDQWVTRGMVVPRAIMFGIFSILFILYGGMFGRGAVRVFKERHLIMIAFLTIFLTDIIILSQMSLIIRHKMVLIPIFYIIVAYGMMWKSQAGYGMALTVSVLVFLANLIVYSAGVL